MIRAQFFTVGTAENVLKCQLCITMPYREVLRFESQLPPTRIGVQTLVSEYRIMSGLLSRHFDGTSKSLRRQIIQELNSPLFYQIVYVSYAGMLLVCILKSELGIINTDD